MGKREGRGGREGGRKRRGSGRLKGMEERRKERGRGDMKGGKDEEEGDKGYLEGSRKRTEDRHTKKR